MYAVISRLLNYCIQNTVLLLMARTTPYSRLTLCCRVHSWLCLRNNSCYRRKLAAVDYRCLGFNYLFTDPTTLQGGRSRLQSQLPHDSRRLPSHGRSVWRTWTPVYSSGKLLHHLSFYFYDISC